MIAKESFARRISDFPGCSTRGRLAANDNELSGPPVSPAPIASAKVRHANDNRPPASRVQPDGGRYAASSELHQGCCLDLMSFIPDGSVDLILADLPYQTTACAWDQMIPLDQMWAHYKRVIAPTGVIVLHAAQPFTTVLAAANLKWLKESLVWEKSRATGFLHTNYPTSILRFPSERKTVHPTQKPVALAEYLLRSYSNDGDIVLDNCMGSGTTGVACANVGSRHFIGIEQDPAYFALAMARIKNARVAA